MTKQEQKKVDQQIGDAYSKGFITGAQAAASVANSYTTTHPYRLDDCILSKLNIRKTKPRKNRPIWDLVPTLTCDCGPNWIGKHKPSCPASATGKRI